MMWVPLAGQSVKAARTTYCSEDLKDETGMSYEDTAQSHAGQRKELAKALGQGRVWSGL